MNTLTAYGVWQLGVWQLVIKPLYDHVSYNHCITRFFHDKGHHNYTLFADLNIFVAF
jgi:hypothetical protein